MGGLPGGNRSQLPGPTLAQTASVSWARPMLRKCWAPSGLEWPPSLPQTGRASGKPHRAKLKITAALTGF